MNDQKVERKTICFLTHEIITGGLENVLIEALKVLHSQYDIRIISLYDGIEQDVLERFPDDVQVINGCDVKNPIINRLKGRKYFSKFYFDKVLGRKFDYVISLKSLERFACFSNKGRNKIFWCHNDSHTTYMSSNLNKEVEKGKRLTEILYKKHDMIWTVNENIANELHDIFPSNNFYALPNPINCNEIVRKSLEPCDLIFDKTKTNIVLLGRISAEKGFGRVINIMRQGIFDKFPNVHVYIIGGCPNMDSFQKKLDERGISDRVTLLGSKANPYPYLKQAQLLISPSRYESFGLVIMEAMLLHVPVIATATTGAKYVTQNGKYAWCVENDDDALSAAIYRFLDDPSVYHYPQADIEKWVWKHDTEKFGERLIELLEKLD